LVDRLPCGSSDKYVTIDRGEAMRFEESGKVDNTGEFSKFGQLFRHQAGNYENWKQNHQDSRALSVKFTGEDGIDAGGPYREMLTNLVQELESGVIPLIVKSQNNKNNNGEYRDCYVVNHQSITPTH